MSQLNLTNDELLTTTRAVRKRLDFDRPVAKELIEKCLNIALQAPSGSNLNDWHWIVVDDPKIIKELARIYAEAQLSYMDSFKDSGYRGANVPEAEKIASSVHYLRENFHRLPAVLIPLKKERTDQVVGNAFKQASAWGSIIQSVWSFMLALRARGLGSAWTTIHLRQERDVADLLGIPFDDYMQVGMFPIAYTVGTDFRPGRRDDIKKVLSWNQFQVS